MIFFESFCQEAEKLASSKKIKKGLYRDRSGKIRERTTVNGRFAIGDKPMKSMITEPSKNAAVSNIYAPKRPEKGGAVKLHTDRMLTRLSSKKPTNPMKHMEPKEEIKPI